MIGWINCDLLPCLGWLYANRPRFFFSFEDSSLVTPIDVNEGLIIFIERDFSFSDELTVNDNHPMSLYLLSRS